MTDINFNLKKGRLTPYDFIEYTEFYSEYPIEFIKQALKAGFTIDRILEIAKINKQTIKLFNAFFSPYKIADRLIELSGIKNETREDIEILEGQAGAGNIIDRLLLNDNSKCYKIDAIELLKTFNNILHAKFNDFKNIKIEHNNFMDIETNKKYDYIFGNPPFNVSTYNKKLDKNEKVNDIDFLMKSYELLKSGGVLVFLLSSSFIENHKPKYKNFKKFADSLGINYYQEEAITKFEKTEAGVIELGTTNINMIIIKIIKP